MINVGICGFAHGHVFSFTKEWASAPDKYDVRVTDIWDSDNDRLESALPRFPEGVKAHSSLADLLASDISAVVVTTETAFHAEACIAAANAGKDIILYKPMALNIKEADSIIEAVERNGVRLAMGWQMRSDAQNARMREIVKNGELGKTCLFRRRHGLATHTWRDFENTWHVNPKLNRDIFFDDSAHPINLMLWMFGMPSTVYCEMSTMLNEKIPNDNCVALFKYDNGMIAEISCSFTTSAAEITTEIYLERGSVQQYYGDAPATRLPRANSASGLSWYREGDKCWTVSDIPSPKAHSERLAWQAEPFAEFLHGAQPLCDMYEGRDTLRLVLACYLSYARGERVSVYDDEILSI